MAAHEGGAADLRRPENIPYSRSAMLRLELKLHEGRYALARLAPGSAAPPWVEGEFTAVLRSAQGLTACCRESAVPPDVEAQGGFRCFEIAGPFDLASIGVAAAAAGPLAAAGISLFVFSTWETDFILVPVDRLDAAIGTLKAAGHNVLAAL
jgi:hypothetical protein